MKQIITLEEKQMKNMNKPRVGILGLTLENLGWASVLSSHDIMVLCSDLDEDLVESCVAEEFSGYAIGLLDKLKQGEISGYLSFTTAVRQLIKSTDIIFVDAMLPQDEKGVSSLRFLESSLRQVASLSEENKLVVLRSIMPVGSTQKLQEMINDQLRDRDMTTPIEIRLVAMPFLFSGGHLIESMEKTGNFPVGIDEGEDLPPELDQIFQMLQVGRGRIQLCTTREAEMTAFAYSGLVAMTQAYVNEVAGLCKTMDIEGDVVAKLINKELSKNSVITTPTIGFGGSHLARETMELTSLGRQSKVPITMGEVALKANGKRKKDEISKLLKLIKIKEGRIAILGGAAVPNSDDFRDAPALDMIKALAQTENHLTFYTPHGMDQAKWRLYKERDGISFYNSAAEATKGADILILLGNFKGQEKILSKALAKRMKGQLILDFVGAFNKKKAATLGFEYNRI